MSLGDLDLITVTGRYRFFNDTAPLTGSKVTFTASVALREPGTPQIILANPLVADVDPDDGTFSVALPATDDPDVEPTGFTYAVLEEIIGPAGKVVRTYSIAVPLNSPGGVLDLVTTAPAQPVTPSASYVLASAFNDLVGRVDTLEQTGGGGEGAALSSDPPANLAASASAGAAEVAARGDHVHAQDGLATDTELTTGLAGKAATAHNHAGSAITSGTVGFGRLPTGTSSSTVAVGDHTHPGGSFANVVEDTTPQLGGQLDVNGYALGDGTRPLVSFTEDPSAVNHVDVENEAAGGGPKLKAAGSDVDVDLHLAAKGAGSVTLDSPLDADGNLLSNVADPVADQDAATKAWVLGRAFQTLVGDGTETDITVTHGLGVTCIVWQLQDVVTGEKVGAAEYHVNSNQTQLVFETPPETDSIHFSAIGFMV